MADGFIHRFERKFDLLNDGSKSSTKNSNRQKELRLNDIQPYINRPRDTFSLFHNPVLSSLHFQKKENGYNNSNSLNSFSNLNANYHKRIKLAAIDSKYHIDKQQIQLNNISQILNNKNNIKKVKEKEKEKAITKSFLLNNDIQFQRIKGMTKFIDCFYSNASSKASIVKYFTAKKIIDTSRNNSHCKYHLSNKKKLPVLYINSSRKIRLLNNNSNTSSHSTIKPMKKIYSHLDIKTVSLDLNT